MRTLKHHEKKLLKKVDFIQWKGENNIKEIKIMRMYHIQKREDYAKYNRLCGFIRSLASKLAVLDASDSLRIITTDLLLDKLYKMGLINTKSSLSQCEKLSTSAFCRRRLPVVLVRLKMAETVKQAVTYVEQGHLRVGPDIVTDPAYLVSRPMEDYVTWVDDSKIRQHILKYNNKLDDFDLL